MSATAEQKVDYQKLGEKQLKAPETTFDKFFTKLISWVEERNARHSAVGNPPIYDPKLFPWMTEIEREWPLIRKELDVLLKRRDELPSFHEVTDEVATITQDDNWKTFFLMGYGLKVEQNCQQCPQTTRIVEKIPGLKTAMFSILSGGKHIPAHRGPYNGVLRYHLGLVVPRDPEKCRIRVADEYYVWHEGQGVVFDDCFNHEVWNETDDVRVVLFVDFERPIKFPYSLLNKFILRASMLTPYIREANDNNEKWAKKFYSKDAKQGN